MDSIIKVIRKEVALKTIILNVKSMLSSVKSMLNQVKFMLNGVVI